MRIAKWAALAGLLLSTPIFAQGNADWHRPFPPFRIAGNLYYVGTADLAVYLIATPQGNVLINSDFAEDVPIVREVVVILLAERPVSDAQQAVVDSLLAHDWAPMLE